MSSLRRQVRAACRARLEIHGKRASSARWVRTFHGVTPRTALHGHILGHTGQRLHQYRALIGAVAVAQVAMDAFHLVQVHQVFLSDRHKPCRNPNEKPTHGIAWLLALGLSLSGCAADCANDRRWLTVPIIIKTSDRLETIDRR